jgi:uncharacterized protein involved in exopolysaccharide biosynthesis
MQRLESDRGAAQVEYEAAARRMRELSSFAGSSGERLKVIDPGIVPERPSSPRTSLYVAVAALTALLGSIVFLSFRYGLRV